MKITVKEKQVADEKEFPCLMISRSKKIIVLARDKVAHADFSGTVIHSDNNAYPVGYTSSHWDGLFFKPFIGSVTLGD